jgi:predicted transcriptional regulator
MATTLTIRLSEDDYQLIKGFAKAERRTMTDVVKIAVLDQIEDKYWAKRADEAWEEHLRNPVSFSLDEVK